jgi:hypothetical protein
VIRATQAALLVFLIVASLAAAAIAWAGYDAHLLISGVGGRLNGKSGILARAEGIEQKAFATLDNTDKATKTWANAAKAQAGSIDDLATDVHGTLSEANTSIQSIRPVTAALADEVSALHKTTDEATRGAAALADGAEAAKTTILAARPALEGLARDEDSLNTLLGDQAIHQTFANAADSFGNMNGILADGRKVADKATADFLRPVPWWKQPVSKGGALIDILAAAARHTP